MCELIDLIKSRRSTRSFIAGKAPSRAQLEQLAEAAKWAPSGMGKQLWHFSVLCNAERTMELARAVAKAGNRGQEYNFYNAPSMVIVAYKRDEIHAFLDGSAALQNILLAAQSLGLGSCWINQVRDTCDDPAVRALLTSYGIPEDYLVIGCAAIGYIGKESSAAPRRSNTVTFIE